MQWLLGGGVAAGLVGVVALGLYLAKMAANNRSDLHKLVQSVKDLADARRDNDGYQRRVEDLENALAAKTQELDRERDGLRMAREALARAQKKLAARGDAAGVASDINDTLGRLSEMSSVPEAAPPSDGNG